jgi:hypothetical protein
MQNTFFSAPPATNGFRAPSFAKPKTLPMHRWVPWVAGFSAEFVEACLKIYLGDNAPEACLLGPFAGIGTTLVEAYLRGLNVMGF